MVADINIDSYDWGNVNSPWIGAEPHIWNLLTQGRPVLQYPAKSVVFSQGDPYRDAFIIMSGRVRHSIFSEVGQEKQLYIACPGAMIGEIFLYPQQTPQHDSHRHRAHRAHQDPQQRITAAVSQRSYACRLDAAIRGPQSTNADRTAGKPEL